MAFDPPAPGQLQRHWRGLTFACLAVLAAGFLLPGVVPKPELEENRDLAAAPTRPRSWAELRAWPKAMDAYVADHFPARSQLIGGLNYLRYRLGVSGTPRVIVGRDGWLYYDDGTHLAPARNAPAYSDAQASDWLLGLAGRSEWLEARGAHYLVLVGADKEIVEPEHGPSWYRGPDPNRAAALLSRLNRTAQAGAIVYPAPTLQRQARWGLKVYNRYETHWTGLGAYTAYVGVMLRLQAAGITDGPKPLGAFQEVAPDQYKPSNLAQMLGIGGLVDADYPQFLDPTVTPKITWLASGRIWNSPQVVDTGLAGKPVLLMVRDSFSLALLPFLEGHFSRIVLLHNQDGFWRPDMIARFHPDVVMSEAIESGAPYIMSGSPPASDAARARIAGALAEPHRVTVQVAARASRPPTNRIDGGPGDDLLRGTPAGDAIKGLAGNDTIEGLDGDDVLRGGRGNDVVSGGRGQDWISGDFGDDTLTGGPDADTFHFAPGYGNDLVTDFSIAEGDRVELPAGTAYTLRQQGADTVLELTSGRLTLRGVRAADLPTGWLTSR
jgi:hypothetical protein